MTGSLLARRAFPSVVVLGGLPGAAPAQAPAPVVPDATAAVVGCAACDGGASHRFGKHYRPPPPPPGWNYPGLPPGPYLTYDYPFKGWPGYRGAYGNLFPGTKHHPHPGVPVYAPLPTVISDAAMVHPWNGRRTLGLGLGYYGWIGPYAASPRPKPVTVGVWPRPPVSGPVLVGEPVLPAGGDPAGGCLTLSVRVPVAGAEVFVEGTRTAQTGTDRVFESPPLESGKEYRYDLVARWVENGQPVERRADVRGGPGETLRVDFTAGDAVTVRR